MSESSDPDMERNALRDQIIGLGSRSLRKSYYPQLQQQIDELKAARGRAEENEWKFRTLYEGISDGVIVADADTLRIMKANPAFCQMLGYTEAELSQLTIAAIHSAEIMPWVMEQLAKVSYRTSSLIKNLPFKRKDGTIFYSETNSTAIDLDNRHCWLGVCRDITERTLAEQKLRRSEADLGRAQAIAHLGSWSWDIVSDQITWSDEMFRIYGVDPSTFDGSLAGLAHLTHPDDLWKRDRTIRETLAGRPPEPYDYRIIRPDGTERVVEVKGMQLEADAEGRTQRMFGVAQDITERKRAEDELHRFNRLYAVLSQVNQTVIHAGSHQELLEEVCKIAIEFGGFKMAWVGKINPETQQVIPVASAGDEGGYLNKITVYADDRPEGRGPSGTSIREERTYVCNDFQHDPGTLPWREEAARVGYRANISLPLKNEGKIYGALTVYAGELDFFHSKEVKLLEEVAADISFALDYLDRETQRRQNMTMLQQAKEDAEAANRAKDQFIAVLSHELRTPLTPVLTAITLLQSHEELTEAVRTDLDVIQRNVKLEAKLIDDLLDVTRISRGMIELHREVVDVHACLMKTLEMCQSEIAEKSIEVSLSLRARDYHVWADSARLQQVFWNLLKNAVKFTPEEGRICLHTTNTERRLRIEVADTGIGIEPEVLPSIFNAFEQGEQTRSRRFGGLGLGLSIAKAVVELHKGSITAYSAGQNMGSVFTVELGTIAAVPSAPIEGVAFSPPKDAQRKILLVEDHADTLRILCRLLQKWGYVVKCSGSVAKALELADRESFDILVSDIGLPDGSGLDIMRQTKERYGLRGIALSGFGTDDDLRQSRAAGFEEHLTKPVGIESLRAAVERMMASGRD